MKLRSLAPAKVNLSLFLGPTRPDGRHALVTLFQSLSLADTLDLEVLPEGARDEVICPGVTGENLVSLALAALRARGWEGPPLRVSVQKRIPIAAGMAGGSADAAALLRLAMSVLPGRPEETEAVAARLGSDVPSQMLPGVVLGTGAGDRAERFERLAEHAYVIVRSPFELATPDVYREADRLGLGRDAAELQTRYAELVELLETGGARVPDELIVNDLQPAAISLCPWVGEALEAVAQAGADNALVSGSGPTVVGVLWGEGCAERASDAAAILRSRFPGVDEAAPVDAEFAMPELR